MDLRRLGEFGLLRQIGRWVPVGPKAVRLGIGDDAAVYRPRPGWDLLATTDLLVEGIDFNLSAGASYPQIGYRALAVNLSDIAAMGGRPVAYLVSLAVPARTPVRAVKELYRGMLKLGRRFEVALVGGDLSESRSGIMISLTLLGEIEPGRALTRSGGRAGDRLFVTGTLGDSKAGLEILKAQGGRSARALSRTESALVRRHLYPTPRIEAGRILSRRGWATAAVDLSDGLAADLAHLCTAGGLGARIQLDRIPLSRALRSHHPRPLALALSGGEDFELLFSVPPGRAGRVRAWAAASGQRITEIGWLVSKNLGLKAVKADGAERPIDLKGYDHFRRAE